MKSLSKSIKIMFSFDFIILFASTSFVGNLCEFSINLLAFSISFIVITGLITNYLKGNYKIREFNPTLWNFYRMLEGTVFAHIPIGTLLYFYIDKLTLIKFLVLNILIIYLIFCIYRLCFHYYLFKLKRVKKILIVGANKRAKVLIDEITNKPALRMEIAGVVKTDEIEQKIREITRAVFHLTKDEEDILTVENRQENFVTDSNIPIFEDGKDIYNIVQKTNADIVIFTYASQLISTIPRNIKGYLMPEFYEIVTGKFYIDFKNAVDFRCEFSRKNTLLYDFLKRAFDIISALIILIATLPITAYITTRVKLTDGASPFFSQTRIGQDGKTFKCYKIRTMYINEYIPKNAEMLNDGTDRTIPFCKWVRKTKLDEIPQMINILRGEMSIVGPRAEWEKFASVFDKDIPFYRMRNLIKSGWTGWAHINMKAAYSIEEEKERLSYDLYYIKHRNILWDLAILIKAIFMACGGRHK